MTSLRTSLATSPDPRDRSQIVRHNKAGAIGRLHTIDITGLVSAHRVVFAGNGGADTVIGTPRPQGVFGVSDGIDALTGVRDPGGRGLAPELGRLTADDAIDALMLQAMLDMPGQALGRTMIETPLDQLPLEMIAEAAPVQLTHDALGDHLANLHDTRVTPAEVDYFLG